MNNDGKKKIRLSAAWISMILLLLSVTMVWGISSGWDSVKMQRLNFTYATDSGQYTGSAIMMAPKSATSTKKVPGVLILGGASSYSYALKSYGIELSRRGYAVMLCDMPGQGLSNYVGHSGGYGSYTPKVGQPNGGEDVTSYIDSAATILRELNYVDPERLTIGGFSAGQSWSAQQVSWNPGVFKTVITLSGYNEKFQKIVTESGTNFIGIKGDGLSNPDSYPDFNTAPGELTGIGSFEEGNAVYCYLNTSEVQHQMQPINGGLISGILKAFELCSPTGSPIASDDLVYMQAEVWSAVAIISLFVLITCILKAVLSMGFFGSIYRPQPMNYPVLCGADPDLQKRRIKSIAFLSFRILAVIVLYELLAARFQPIPLFYGTPWAGLWINIWVPFLAANMVVNLALFLIWHRRYGKPNGGNAYHYGLTWEGTLARNLGNIGKCIGLGLVIVFIVLSFLAFLDGLLAVNLKVMIFGMITFNMEHMLQMPSYVLLYIALLFTASLTQYITNPSYEDGTGRGRVIATVRTTFIAILPYLVLCTWNTLKGMSLIKMAGTYTIDQFAPLDNMYGYPIMMALVTPIMDMLYRKTKSVWPGVIVCAMLIGVLIACNYSLNETWFG